MVAGVAYRVAVLASGLTRDQAREREHREIAALAHPLNAAGPVRAWADPLEPAAAEQGAVAKLRYQAGA